MTERERDARTALRDARIHRDRVLKRWTVAKDRMDALVAELAAASAEVTKANNEVETHERPN